MDQVQVKRFSGNFVLVTITGHSVESPWIYTGRIGDNIWQGKPIAFTWNPNIYCYEEIETAVA